MIVCVDIQAAIAQRAGVGRYVKSLVEHLGAFAGPDTLRLFYFDFRRNGIPFTTPGADRKAVRWMPGQLAQQAWKTLGWPPHDWFSGAADLYHFTNFVRPPLSSGRSVINVYDVSFLRLPDAAEPRNLAYLRRRIQDSVSRADAIITISEFSRREIIELLHVPEDRVVSIHPGLDHGCRRPAEDEIIRTRRALSLNRPYLLFVSTMEPRKNIPFLIEVFETLDTYDGELVLAGMRGWKVDPILERIRSSPKTGRIRYLEYVPDRHLPGLYAGADLFVFPSLYEGFGFPPLEAMACGTPVVSSAGGALPEVLGDAARIVAEFDVGAWVEAIEDRLAHATGREEIRAQGRAHAARYTWEAVAKETWNVYRRVTA